MESAVTGSSRPTVPPPLQVQRPHPTAPFHPHGDTATYRDLLLFEERLKMNAEMLRRRRRRYNIFLYTFVLATLVMAHRLILNPPQTYVSLRALQGLLAVVLITLVLFFASGMYDEKIRYARSYLTYSNKALRPLNMHLNTRRPPIFHTILSYLPSIVRPSQFSQSSSTSTPAAIAPASTLNSKLRRPSSSGIMPSIPPSSNPRGELIFSSRVDRGFREGYERYRSAFERRREEKERKERAGWWKVWRKRGGDTPTSNSTVGTGGEKGKILPTPPISRRGTPPIPISTTSSSSSTPTTSGMVNKGRTRTPSPGSGLRFEDKGVPGRERAESYSFVWTGHKDTGPLKRAP